MFLLVVGFAALSVVRAARELEAGRSTLLRARDHLEDGAFGAAAGDFRDARARFLDAQGLVSNPFVALASAVPLVGRTPDGIRAMTDAAVLASVAGGRLASAVEHLKGGLEALSLAGSRIPVGRLEGLRPALEAAGAGLHDALRLANGVATTFVPEQVVEAGDELRSTLTGAISTLSAADATLGALPEVAGMERPKRYFLAPQDPTDLRGTGGAFNFWAILTIDKGRISLGPFHDLVELPDARGVTWPTPELQAAYGSIGTNSAWAYANAPADVPTAAARIESLWEAARPDPIDGVILVDPSALASMLGATDPIAVRGVDVTLTGEDAVPFLTHSAYLLPGGLDLRLEYVRSAALGIFRSFLADARGFAAIRALVHAAADHHLLVNATDPAVQAQLEAAGITGSIAPRDGGDLFALAFNNLAGNRIDYYVRRTIQHDVTLLGFGQAQATTTITFENRSSRQAPTGALQRLLVPRWGPTDLEPGEAFEEALVTCGAACRLTSASIDGESLPITTREVGGLTTFRSIVRIPPGTTSTVVMTFELGRVWAGDGAQGAYALSMLTQPTFPGTTTSMTVRAPDGMSISAARPGIDRGGSLMRWSGSEPARDIWVRFERGALGRIWWALQNVLLQR